MSRRSRAAAMRMVWIVLAVGAMAVIYPWRSVDNAEEVAAAQAFVDRMAMAHDEVAGGYSTIDDFTVADDGFAGFATATPGGVAAMGLIGLSDDNCVVMHWTAPDIAQVGRLRAGETCDPGQVQEVPIRPNGGYVPGTGPPFDVAPLIREANTPLWFLAALTLLAWVVIRASLDLFLIFQRPDYFFSEK